MSISAMNYIDYEDELADAFCSANCDESEWAMTYFHRPENPMTKNILRREMLGHGRPPLMANEDRDSMSRKRRQPNGSPMKSGNNETTHRRVLSRSMSKDDIMMMWDISSCSSDSRLSFSHQRVVSDDSRSDRSVFSQD